MLPETISGENCFVDRDAYQVEQLKGDPRRLSPSEKVFPRFGPRQTNSYPHGGLAATPHPPNFANLPSGSPRRGSPRRSSMDSLFSDRPAGSPRLSHDSRRFGSEEVRKSYYLSELDSQYLSPMMTYASPRALLDYESSDEDPRFYTDGSDDETTTLTSQKELHWTPAETQRNKVVGKLLYFFGLICVFCLAGVIFKWGTGSGETPAAVSPVKGSSTYLRGPTVRDGSSPRERRLSRKTSLRRAGSLTAAGGRSRRRMTTRRMHDVAPRDARWSDEDGDASFREESELRRAYQKIQQRLAEAENPIHSEYWSPRRVSSPLKQAQD